MRPLPQPIHNPTAPALCVGLLQAVLEQVDYGLAVVNADTRQVLFANSPAWADLHPDGNLLASMSVDEGKLCARQPCHAEQLASALVQTKAGRRGLLHSVAVMPLSVLGMTNSQSGPSGLASEAAPAYALLVFPKQQACDSTTITLFARERGLTSTEGRVLMMVCKGLRPQQIATQQGVQISTVRTQLRSIRQKTASNSVRELIAKVSGLPPMAVHLSRFFDLQASPVASVAVFT